MKAKTFPTEQVILVCTRCNAKRLPSKMRRRVKERHLKESVRVLEVECLHACDKGPNVAVMPQNVLYSGVKARDLDAILDALPQACPAPL